MSFLRSRAIALVLGAATLGALTVVPEREAQAQGVVYGPGTHPRRSGTGLGLGGVGLILLGGGLVASAGGFALLYACRSGESCHNDTTTTLGWVLAAPGLPPIALGALFLLIAKPDSSN